MLILANNIKQLREARGLHQCELADRAGISHKHMYMIEAGRANPSLDVALAIRRGLGCKLDEMFPPDPAPAPAA